MVAFGLKFDNGRTGQRAVSRRAQFTRIPSVPIFTQTYRKTPLISWGYATT